ncbi:MAG: ABC transporter ATP-binding protein [Planctomycetaceae bacterium]|nr:ABC transporter ATP-binding protein [Planctomycetaceae bacterium]
MLELINVIKTYPAQGGTTTVLQDINCALRPGQIAAIMGPSGSGKTTLLNLMGGLDQPTSGKVMLDQKNLAVLRPGELALVRNTKIGFVFQLHYLLPQCTVLENVLLPTLATPASRRQAEHAEKRAMELLERTGMEKYAAALPGQLSGGQRQRAALVRALINKPQIILADEPTGAVDARTAEQIIDLLVEMNQVQGSLLVIATHSETIARRAHRRFQLENACLSETGLS